MQRKMTPRILFSLLVLIAASNRLEGAISDWVSAPKPKFPSAALKKFTEGSVELRVVLNSDGRVQKSIVTKSSGDSSLDEAAQNAVAQWRMKPSAIKPLDLTKGRDTIVDFKQEAPIAARYPDRVAAFTSDKDAIADQPGMWMFAPFPSYPRQARERHEEGEALVRGIIGKAGKVEKVELAKSSGHSYLDQAALRAVALWRAHPKYAGQKFIFPIVFSLARKF